MPDEPAQASVLPRALRARTQAAVLEVEWTDGRVDELAFGLLRRLCPCAQCRQLRRSGAPVPVHEDVSLARVEAYGPNAVHLAFSDGHARGIFPFAYLREIGQIAAGLSIFVEGPNDF